MYESYWFTTIFRSSCARTGDGADGAATRFVMRLYINNNHTANGCTGYIQLYNGFSLKSCSGLTIGDCRDSIYCGYAIRNDGTRQDCSVLTSMRSYTQWMPKMYRCRIRCCIKITFSPFNVINCVVGNPGTYV